jgi:hypothetical protein
MRGSGFVECKGDFGSLDNLDIKLLLFPVFVLKVLPN